jgi:PAS domain S-box-containing protein
LLVALRTRALEQETSDREAAEHAALAETMRQAALLQTASDGIHILDEQGRLTECSPSFASMLGYDMEKCASLSLATGTAQSARQLQQLITHQRHWPAL